MLPLRHRWLPLLLRRRALELIYVRIPAAVLIVKKHSKHATLRRGRRAPTGSPQLWRGDAERDQSHRHVYQRDSQRRELQS